MEPGEIIPCDGIFISGHNVRCDESGITGGSDAVRKISFYDCELPKREDPYDHVLDDGGVSADCFVLSGSRVLEGYGKYVVIAVGQKSLYGRIMMGTLCNLLPVLELMVFAALRRDHDPGTPLQKKLKKFAELIAKIGCAAGLILFVALMVRFFVQLGTGESARCAFPPRRTLSRPNIA